MAMRQILDERDGSLRKKSREVTSFDFRLHMLLDDMVETLKDSGGAGLAAVQVGVLRRVFITDIEGIIEFVNPKIVECSEETQDEAEGCLSFPGQYGMVVRPSRVRIEAQDRYGRPFSIDTEDEMLARCVCHEYDHLDGILFYDLASEMMDEEEAERRQRIKDAEAEKAGKKPRKFRKVKKRK